MVYTRDGVVWHKIAFVHKAHVVRKVGLALPPILMCTLPHASATLPQVIVMLKYFSLLYVSRFLSILFSDVLNELADDHVV